MGSSTYTKYWFAAVFLVLCLSEITGATGHREGESTNTIAEGGLNPQSFKQIILTWQTAPHNSQAVTWQTHIPLNRALAEIAPSDPSPGFVDRSRQYQAETTVLETGRGPIYYHSVNFRNLSPNTLYAYRVGEGGIWSEWFQFRTASEAPADFSFIYLGDAQDDIFSLWSRAIRAAFLDAPKARFIVHAGDLINHKNSESEWREWFKAGGWIMAMIPSLPAAGNHEYKKHGPGRRSLSKFWKPQFALPAIGRKDLDETVYHIDFQGLRLIVLNSNLAIKYQATWLEGILSDNPNKWTVIAFHHPIFSAAKGRNNKKLARHWKPIFEKRGVDLVLQGHDHVYMRLRDGCVDGIDCRGPVYITSVSGPKMYRLDSRHWHDRAGENTQLFQVISISGHRLQYQSITVTGEVYDAFDLVKDEKTLLIEKIPENAKHNEIKTPPFQLDKQFQK